MCRCTVICYFYMTSAYTQVSDYITHLCQFTCVESNYVDDASVTDCGNEIVNVNMSDLCTQSTYVLCNTLHCHIHTTWNNSETTSCYVMHITHWRYLNSHYPDFLELTDCPWDSKEPLLCCQHCRTSKGKLSHHSTEWISSNWFTTQSKCMPFPL